MSPMRDTADAAVLAQDPSLESAELLTLAAHRDPQVRAAVAARTDAPMAALMSLGYDPSLDVLHALLRNPRTPSSVVRKLSDHRNAALADAAVQRLRNGYR
nr:hypothetical protein [Demequina sp. NBRC 110055]